MDLMEIMMLLTESLTLLFITEVWDCEWHQRRRKYRWSRQIHGG